MKWAIGLSLCMMGIVGCAHKAPEEFPISFWCGPPEKFVTQDRYNEIREAHFTIAFPACGGGTDALNHRILAYCKQAKLKAFIVAPGMPQAINRPPIRGGGSTGSTAEYPRTGPRSAYRIFSRGRTRPDCVCFPRPGRGIFPRKRPAASRLH